MLFEDRVF